MTRRPILATAMASSFLLMAAAAQAEPIRNPLAVFAGLDKVTGKIRSFQIRSTRRAASAISSYAARLLLPSRHRGTEDHVLRGGRRAAAIVLQTNFFRLDARRKSGLNAVEHPVYDVWLTGCRDPNAPKPPQEAPPPPVDLEQADVPKDND
jgi:hypothetical protein